MENTNETADGSVSWSRIAESQSVQEYRTILAESIDQPPIAAEFIAWRNYVQNRHGDVFARLADEASETGNKASETIDAEPDVASAAEADEPHNSEGGEWPPDARPRESIARDLFVETLAFDFLLLTLLRTAESRFGCSLTRPIDADAAIPFEADFETVHRYVTSKQDDVEAPRDGERLSQNTPLERQASLFVRDAEPRDVASLHRESVSRLFRRAFGRYDTPNGLAALAVESVCEGAEAGGVDPDLASGPDHIEGTESGTALDDLPLVVDPGCGAGAFLAAAAKWMQSQKLPAEPLSHDAFSPRDQLRTLLESVRGFDVSPTAVRASRLAVVLAARPLFVEAGNSIGETRDSTEGVRGSTGETRDSTGSVRCSMNGSDSQRRSSDAHSPLSFTPRVVLGDAIAATVDAPPLDGQRADVLLANPPWLTWNTLPERAKKRWRDGPVADDDIDLFGRSGREARLGYANDDLSVPYAWTCLHRLLRDGGRAAVVLKRDLLRAPAGERIRRPSLGDRRITYERVHDFDTLTPFADVDAGTALLSLRIGEPPTEFPSEPTHPFPTGDGVPMTRWSRNSDGTDPPSSSSPSSTGTSPPSSSSASSASSPQSLESSPRPSESSSRPSGPSFQSLASMRSSTARVETRLVSSDPADPDPENPWIPADAENRALGTNAYRIRHGVKDDAKAVYAVDRSTIERHGLESDHVYPYLKSKHIVKYGLFGHDLQLVPQRRAGADNEAELRRQTPQTYAYLEAHRGRLRDRGSSWFEGGPFYSLFGLGPYTWSDYKVVWCRLGFKPHFAVVSTVTDSLVGEKTVVPGDHCMFVGTDDEREAHYLCALLNSAPYQRCLRDISSGGKSSLSKSTVERVAMPEWRATGRQRRLAELSQRAHDIVPEHVDCSKRAYNGKTIPELDAVQTEIDRTVELLLREPVDSVS
ncbi:type I restriction endonuclease subunit M [Halobellus sp. GM3]|uniref:type I restriction endonuclease subunit M n=1 Tax=Halobellus sp. GM3 TaxID=3458410 RepID=UPI00403E248C